MARKRSILDIWKDELTAEQHDYPAEPLPDGPESQTVFGFAAPCAPVSMNATNKHWAELRVARQQWKTAAYTATLEASAALAQFRGHRVEVTVALPVPDRRRRDPHNYTETVKRIIDGIVNAGVLIPDDEAKWCAVPEPVLWLGDHVRVRVRVAPPREDPTSW